MKVLSVLVLIVGLMDVVQAADGETQYKVFGAEAEDIIFHGTVVDISSNDSPYGIKYYYRVLYYGYEWMCEQATHRTACHRRK